ncbi:MAG: hypothetical protein NC541_02725 [bacterium]|nr:hypothetical protein [bacterium]
MKYSPKMRKYLLSAGVFFLICFLFLTFFALRLRQKINNIELFESYRITCGESADDSAELLKQLCRDRLGVRLYRSTDYSHLFLYLIENGEEAAESGFSLDGITDKGFLITRRGNALYLLSKTPEGMRRACYYLVYHLIDEEGLLRMALDERYTDTGKNVYDDILAGDLSLNDYTVTLSKDVPKALACDLIYYINQACGALPEITAEPGAASLYLSLDGRLPSGSCEITAENGGITIRGADSASLTDGIRLFANTYLGWIHAGTPEESRHVTSSVLRIPAEIRAGDESWIEEREAIVTLWNINYSRGVFLNNSTSLKNDVMSFSDEQLYDYVKMLKYCGFTGIQATDMCSAWAGAGGMEYVHERLRILADAAHSLDMKFTLWVWGAEFTGYGWTDSTVTYAPPNDGDFAYQNPDVLATFEKYYSYYAELADCCDRVIAHYSDPGNLHTSEDVAYFARLLSEKFLRIKPDIDFGINCWVDEFDKGTLVRELGSNITLYESPSAKDPAFRGFCANSGCRLGAWAWNTCEMEIDQLAAMNYTPHIIQNLYQAARQNDEIKKPDYWSEMDSYHVLNVFSLYCAGHLLTDPDRDVEELTREISLAAVGPEYAEAFADILNLIEDARSGGSWDTYWWSSEDYILTSDAYPAETVYAEAKKAVTVLQEMIDADLQSYSLPLPLPLKEVLQLMLPHLCQIRDYAQFRIGLARAQDMAADGFPAAEIQEQIDAISTPISEYNTVIGLWGQIEARAQQQLLLAFCRENGLEMPRDATFDRDRKFRIYSQFVTDQKGKQEIVYHYSPYFQYNIAYDAQVTDELTEELIEEGLLSSDSATGGVYLTDWEHYSYSFN